VKIGDFIKLTDARFSGLKNMWPENSNIGRITSTCLLADELWYNAKFQGITGRLGIIAEDFVLLDLTDGEKMLWILENE